MNPYHTTSNRLALLLIALVLAVAAGASGCVINAGESERMQCVQERAQCSWVAEMCSPGEGADYTGADLYGADLNGAGLKCARMVGADLYGADLNAADLRGADLRGADLYGADLNGADLTGADLRCASLYGADLNRANLTDVNLTGADMYGVDMDGAIRGESTSGGRPRGTCGERRPRPDPDGPTVVPEEDPAPEREPTYDTSPTR